MGCTKCNQIYNIDSGPDPLKYIKNHVIIHTENPPKCPVCSQCFQSEQHLIFHMAQKKDPNNAHKKYHKEHYQKNEQIVKQKGNKTPKVRKKTIKEKKQIKIKQSKPKSLKSRNFSYHDYDINHHSKNIKNVNNVPPPLLSPDTPNKNEAAEISKRTHLTQKKSEALSPRSPSLHTNAVHNSQFVILPLSTSDQRNDDQYPPPPPPSTTSLR